MRILPANNYQTNNSKQINFGLYQVKAAEPLSDATRALLRESGYQCLSKRTNGLTGDNLICAILETDFGIDLSNYFRKGVVDIVGTSNEVNEIFRKLSGIIWDNAHSVKLKKGWPRVPWKISWPLKSAEAITIDELLKKPAVSK